MRVPQLLPLPMQRYGVRNGLPLYRVVFSDSRTWLVGGTWPGEGFTFKEVPFYPDKDGKWILEKYLSPEEFGPKEEWDRKEAYGDTKLGPYPSSGEWEFCYEFPYTPTDSMISVWIMANSASRKLTAAEKKKSIMDPLMARKKRNEQKVDDVFDEAMHGFRNGRTRLSAAGREPIHMTRSKRRDDMKFKLGAEDLNMPMRDNSFFTGGKDATKPDRRAEGR